MKNETITLDQLLDNPELPSLPEAFLKLNDLIKHDRPIAEITKVIERDPSLATRSLKLANSAWYKRSRTISTVKGAITTIGMDALHQLVFATSVIRTFQGIDKDIADMQAFWNQSLQLACNAKRIKETCGDANAIQMFTSGIVAYVGKLIIYISLPEVSRTILQHSAQHPQLQHVEEQKLLGFSHNEITAALLKKWNIPDTTYVPIQYYTQPQSAPAEHLLNAATLSLAHHLVFKTADELDFGDTSTGLEKTLEMLSLAQDQLPAIQQQAQADGIEAAAIIGIPAHSR
ncbi:MAG: HDOD domain-containing protein [Gammaproteobacteria bacterium]|nr:HDOD domain-containing protein [Gammaproteobacteria bacterium]